MPLEGEIIVSCSGLRRQMEGCICLSVDKVGVFQGKVKSTEKSTEVGSYKMSSGE